MIKNIDSEYWHPSFQKQFYFLEYLIERKTLEISKVCYSWTYLKILMEFPAEIKWFRKKEQQKALSEIIASVDLVCFYNRLFCFELTGT